jgi:hypothetical protein
MSVIRTAVRLNPRSKYHAQPTVVDGIRFHSAAESRYYAWLKLFEKTGDIADIECQPSWELHAPNGEVLGKFVADFRYRFVRSGEVTVIDVKGMKTLPLARWKQKHLRAEYGIVVTEVR